VSARIPRLLVVVLAAGGLGGCAGPSAAKVKPWQRAALADDTMNPALDAAGDQMTDHVYFSREASTGGRGVGGSGCGCN
jgi:hypothetical protein